MVGVFQLKLYIGHSVHQGINPPALPHHSKTQKHLPLFFTKPPLKSPNCSSPSFLGNPSTIVMPYWFFCENYPPAPAHFSKNQIFQLKTFLFITFFVVKYFRFVCKICNPPLKNVTSLFTISRPLITEIVQS